MTALRRFRDDHVASDEFSGPAVFESRLIETASRATLGEEAAVLVLADLLPDSGGEIVLRPGGWHRHFRIIAPVLPAETGLAQPHITAAGEDVRGLHFVRFEPGPTLYYPADVELEFILVEA